MAVLVCKYCPHLQCVPTLCRFGVCSPRHLNSVRTVFTTGIFAPGLQDTVFSVLINSLSQVTSFALGLRV